MSKPVLIDFRNQIEAIQKYADDNCDGNFTMAVRMLIRIALVRDGKSWKNQIILFGQTELLLCSF